MKFSIQRTSHKEINYPGVKQTNADTFGKNYEIEINSLEDLKNLEEAFGEKLIISMRFMSIEIYDSYRE